MDTATYAIVNDWMGLGFALLIVGAMHPMRDVFKGTGLRKSDCA